MNRSMNMFLIFVLFVTLCALADFASAIAFHKTTKSKLSSAAGSGVFGVRDKVSALSANESSSSRPASSDEHLIEELRRPMKINVDTSSFVRDNTMRASIRNVVYERELQRLLCDGEDECIF